MRRIVPAAFATALFLLLTAAPAFAATVHTPPATGETPLCLGCHPGNTVTIHTLATTTKPDGTVVKGCTLCHNANIVLPATSDCGGCHVPFAQHINNASHTSTWTLVGCTGDGCHGGSGLIEEHARWRSSFTCATCHSNSTSPLYATAIAAGNTACGACHPGVSATEGHYAVHFATPRLVAPDGTPGYAFYFGSTGSPKTTDCATCHTGNLMDEHLGRSAGGEWVVRPEKDSTGQDLGCDSCHVTLDPAVGAAVAGNLTSCESCHVVHGPIAQVHASTFVDAATLPCAQCHASGLEAVHATVATVTPAGTTLSGCAVCHAYYEGEYGARVQAAISTSNDTRCTACHDAIHADVSALHATDAPSAASCGVDGCHDVTDLTALHAGAAAGACAVCHDNAARVPDLSVKTSACASCHTTFGVDYHVGMAEKHTAPDSAACIGCHPHASSDVTAIHTTGCGTCHNPAKDLTGLTARCDGCHTDEGTTFHVNSLGSHTATASAECVACHEKADVRELHTGGCAVCHANPDVATLPASSECANCHADHTPVDQKHYPAASHVGTETACATCHSLDMKAEHAKPTSGPVSCATCHETKVDTFTRAWDGTCAACHLTKHEAMGTKHVSTKTSCGGTGCHAIGDVAALHEATANRGCTLCHTGPAALPTTDCGSAGCHDDIVGNHHASHSTAGVVDPGCAGCHATYLDDEHAALNLTCASCHDSTNAAVVAAIGGHDRTCDACHPAVNGRDYHGTRNAYEFAPGNQSTHRVTATASGPRTSFGINGAVYTWALPADAAYLKTGWTSSSVVNCQSCHSFASTAAGPHGATVKVNIDPAYAADWHTATLNGGSSHNAPTTVLLCNKCHLLTGNSVHNLSDHDGYKCVDCHAGIPHGWRLPRLLAYTDDPAPYRSNTLTGITVKNRTPSSGWNLSDCTQTGCEEHSSRMSNRWPSQVLTFGTLSGRVTSLAGASLAGVAVSTDKGQSAVTTADGRYSFAGIPTGSYTVRASLAGYDAQSGGFTVLDGQTVAADFVLTPPVNRALGRPFTASRTSGTYVPANAGDGSSATYWWSGTSSSSYDWLRVDLGAATSVSRAEVEWAVGRYATEFRIYTSTDDRTWAQVYSTTGGRGGTSAVTFTARSARYVRVECRRAIGSSAGYGVAEMRVYQ